MKVRQTGGVSRSSHVYNSVQTRPACVYNWPPRGWSVCVTEASVLNCWRQKTRVPGLSCGVVCVILRLAVLVELRLVTDTDSALEVFLNDMRYTNPHFTYLLTYGRTDGHRAMASTADA